MPEIAPRSEASASSPAPAASPEAPPPVMRWLSPVWTSPSAATPKAR